MQPNPPRAGDRPLVTWYHGAAGRRVELSRATFANWVAKTANLLDSELGLQPGDRVALLLPSHWLGPALLAACWRAGLSAVPAATLPGGVACGAAFVHEDRLGEVAARFPGGEPPLLVLSDDLLGRTSAADLGGAAPFARLAASMPDHFDGDGQDPRAEALLVGGAGGARRPWSRADLTRMAGELAAQLDLRDGERLYSGLELDGAAGVVAGAAVPALLETGVVLERDPDREAIGRRLADERITAAAVTAEQAAAIRSTAGPGIRLAVASLTDHSFSRP